MIRHFKGLSYLKKSLAGFAMTALLAGCSPAPVQEESGADTPYQITTTVGMVADIVREVAGDRAVVQGIIGEGVDPHLYKPTVSDVRSLQGADIIFYAGLMLEGKMADVLVKVARKGKPVFAVTELIEEEYLLQPEDMEGHFDPHVWMDVKGWRQAVLAVENAMADVDPAHADQYRANAKAYLAKLDQLDSYVKTAMQSIPEDRRILVTAHDAFNYFGRAYEVDVLGIQGLSTESEAGLEDINRLVDLLVERKVRAVFVESSVARKNVMALIEGTRAKGHEVTIGGELFSDAMGETGTYEGSYIGMIDHNATLIARALGGEAPAQGMQGKLSAHE